MLDIYFPQFLIFQYIGNSLHFSFTIQWKTKNTTLGTFVYKSKMRDKMYFLMSLEGHLAVVNDILTPSSDLFNYLFIVNICKP